MAAKKTPTGVRAMTVAPAENDLVEQASAATAAAPRDLPMALAEVALVAVSTCAAVGEVSEAWWFERVRSGEAPAPVIREPRFTRWRLADVRAFWLARAEAGVANVDAGKRVIAASTKASAAARAKKQLSVRLVPPAAL